MHELCCILDCDISVHLVLNIFKFCKGRPTFLMKTCVQYLPASLIRFFVWSAMRIKAHKAFWGGFFVSMPDCCGPDLILVFWVSHRNCMREHVLCLQEHDWMSGPHAFPPVSSYTSCPYVTYPNFVETFSSLGVFCLTYEWWTDCVHGRGPTFWVFSARFLYFHIWTDLCCSCIKSQPLVIVPALSACLLCVKTSKM